MSQTKSPFKFLDSYKQGDSDVYFGRKNEVRDLYKALQGVKHILVFGPSGSGKTSLIECGLRNQFSEAAWFALSVRREQNIMQSVFARINENLSQKIKLNPETNLPDITEIDPETKFPIDFGQAVKRLFGERYQPIYLLFDQFEELLLLGSDVEKKDFFERLQKLIEYPIPCRVLLVMREEFIGHLSEWEKECPSIFQHRFRLEKMRVKVVKDVIIDILKANKYNSGFKVQNPEALAESMLPNLNASDKEIELAHVQVFLDEIWHRAAEQTAKGEKPILQNTLVREDDDLEHILDSFLKKQLRELAAEHGDKLPIELLATLITERRTKLQASEPEIKGELIRRKVAVPTSLLRLLKDLVERRILRVLKSDEKVNYEISHDVLAKIVGANLTKEMDLRAEAESAYKEYLSQEGALNQSALNRLYFLKHYLDFPKELEERVFESENEIKAKIDRRQRNAWVAGLVAGVLILVALGSSVLFIQKTKDLYLATNKAQTAQDSLEEKTKQFNETVNQLTIQTQNLEDAKIKISRLFEQASAAQEIANKKENAALIAEKKTDEAIRQFGIASENARIARLEADTAALIAESAKAEAQKIALIAGYSLLTSCREEILKLNYKEAYSTVQKISKISLALQSEKGQILLDSIGFECMEIAFFCFHTDNKGVAFASFEDAAGLLRKILHVDYKKDFEKALTELNEQRYFYILNRYFPSMVPIPGGYIIIDGKSFTVQSFNLSKTETNWWQYNLFLESKHKGTVLNASGQYEFRGDLPVGGVTWYDAIEYANWLNFKNGLDTIKIEKNDIYSIKQTNGYRLPTTVEWEYCEPLPLGSTQELVQVAWLSGQKGNSRGITHPVGKKKSNNLGLFDMIGNVSEWCLDCRKIKATPPNEDFYLCPTRGGASRDPISTYLNWYKKELSPTDKSTFQIGFRVARN